MLQNIAWLKTALSVALLGPEYSVRSIDCKILELKPSFCWINELPIATWGTAIRPAVALHIQTSCAGDKWDQCDQCNQCNQCHLICIGINIEPLFQMIMRSNGFPIPFQLSLLLLLTHQVDQVISQRPTWVCTQSSWGRHRMLVVCEYPLWWNRFYWPHDWVSCVWNASPLLIIGCRRENCSNTWDIAFVPFEGQSQMIIIAPENCLRLQRPALLKVTHWLTRSGQCTEAGQSGPHMACPTLTPR